MNNKTNTFFIGFLALAVILLGIKIADLQKQSDMLEARTERNWADIWDITWEVTGHALTGPDNWNPYNDADTRIDKLFEEVWGEAYLRDPMDPENQTYKDCGYTAMKPECPISRIDRTSDWTGDAAQFMNNRSYDLQLLEDRVEELEEFLRFPWISQRGNGAREYEEDCASASLMMVLEYYGMNNFGSVDEMHLHMAGGDNVVDFSVLQNFIENNYPDLKTQVFVTDPTIKDNLENGGWDVSDIMVSETYFWWDKPVLWIYGSTPHWIARFKDYAYDPDQGMIPFDKIPNIYKPWRGLGIIVEVEK